MKCVDKIIMSPVKGVHIIVRLLIMDFYKQTPSYEFSNWLIFLL